MKRFLAIFLGTEANVTKWKELPEAERHAREQKGMDAWNQWGIDHQAAIVDMGAPLGKTKRASRDGISDTKNAMAAYVIVQADSHDAAAKIFENHPHFTIFPGDSIEIMECLPMPGSSE
jgi:hypothetical protein